jgi:predicted ATPase
VLGAEKLVRYSRAAGEQALAADAWEEASSFFQRALDAKEGQAIDADTAALTYGLGRSEAAMSNAYDTGKSWPTR